VREVTERLAVQAAHVGCTIRLSAPPSLDGSWDRLRLEQVVTNLIGNSIKYGRGEPIDVTIAAHAERARISVRDFGIGISPEDEARVFGRFERAVSKRHYGGLGLGLWIARQIVEAHGGHIEFQRPPDVGTCFIVDLPR
jgi:signal transduction histidine kinase